MKRPLRENELSGISKVISQQVNHVICLECCKYYIVPTTATCSHTLCHTCWFGRQICPSCGVKVDRKSLKLNLPLQNLTEHVHNLEDAFKDLFSINQNDFLSLECDIVSGADPTKNVNEWLTSSQNHFSAPINSQESTQDINVPIKVVVNDIQVHSESNKSAKPVLIDQKDWDKIEELPDSEDVLNKDKENIIGPMDIETYDIVTMNDDNKYSMENPRRSSRKKDSDSNKDKQSTENTLNKSNKSNKNWTNVNKMKKEFSKLSKKSNNKLNVSIEMCKTIQSCNNKLITPESAKKVFHIADEKSLDSKCEEINKNDEVSTVLPIRIDDNNLAEINLNRNTNEDNFNDKIEDIKKSDQTNNFELNRFEGDKCVLATIENKCDAKKASQSGSNINKPNVCFFKKSAFNGQKDVRHEENEEIKSESLQTDDIEITIKIGKTLTNIIIKKKDNDVQLKLNSECAVQTSDKKDVVNNINVSTSPIQNIPHDKAINNELVNKSVQANSFGTNIQITTNPTPSISVHKKNTASADTSTINTEIKISNDRDSAPVKEHVQSQNVELVEIHDHIAKNTDKKCLKQSEGLEETDYLNDLDIFDSESVKEGNIQLLKRSVQTPSAIFMPTNVSKLKSQRNNTKRDRGTGDTEEVPFSKKSKIDTSVSSSKEKLKTQKSHYDSELGNYDEIMSQVFANFEADVKDIDKSKDIKRTQNITQTQKVVAQKALSSQVSGKDKDPIKPTTQKYSENIFSMVDNDDSEIDKTDKNMKSNTVTDSTKIRTKAILSDNVKNIQSPSIDYDIDMVELSTPQNNNDDSDKSIVEETPQKDTSLSKKQINTVKVYTRKDTVKSNNPLGKHNESGSAVNIISVSDDSTKVTIIEKAEERQCLETPMSINKFVNQIQFKSTPLAKKSLNFTNNDGDLDQTLCPSSFVAAKNTQELEIMSKAFEQTQYAVEKNIRKNQKYCLAGSCLSSPEQASVKELCSQRNWTYVDRYTKDLTHLIVGVSEGNKAQRSVKFMCALAASKWIVSYDWIEKCMETNQVVDEEAHEVLDMTGEPGPRRSRLARQKLFTGIKFYCMPPFGVLDIDTLKEMLVSAGGVVVEASRDVKATESPALLLAEPEHTQEDRFIYLAMELSIVPVNYEWVLNSLGNYTLNSILELLLCPSSLLPPVTAKWPPALISHDDD